jgi:EpsI family protein
MIRRALIIAGLLIAGALYLNSAARMEPVPIRQSLSGLPRQMGNWSMTEEIEFDNNTLKVLGVDDYVNRIYRGSEGVFINLYIGFYRSQRQGDTIHSPLNCLPGAGWNPKEKDILNVSILDSKKYRNYEINKLIIQKNTDQQVVLYWYQGHGRVVSSEYWGKIYTVLDAIRTNRTDAALVRVISPVIGSEEAAKAKAERDAGDFVKALFPLLDKYLP